MDNYFSEKTLLVLGTNVGSVDIVNYARAHGAHTIVADYLTPIFDFIFSYQPFNIYTLLYL